MKYLGVSLAATLITAPLWAKAETMTLPPPVTGPYVSFGAGINILKNEHIDTATGVAGNASLQSRIGPALVGAIGGRALGFPAAAGGNEVKYGPMFNVLYDLAGLIPFPYAAPYAGLGIGWQLAHFSDVPLMAARRNSRASPLMIPKAPWPIRRSSAWSFRSSSCRVSQQRLNIVSLAQPPETTTSFPVPRPALASPANGK